MFKRSKIKAFLCIKTRSSVQLSLFRPFTLWVGHVFLCSLLYLWVKTWLSRKGVLGNLQNVVFDHQLIDEEMIDGYTEPFWMTVRLWL